MNLDDILNQLPIDQIANQLGVDPATARNAAGVALPALLSGLQANADDPAGAESLSQALSQHDNNLADEVISGQVGIDQIDENDGGHIVNHVFGGNTDQVMSQLAGAGGTNSALVSRVMQMLAPLVMSYLAKRLMGGNSGTAAGGGTSGGGLGEVLNDVLGGAAGGSARTSASGSGGGGLADILGQILGGGATGGSRSASGGNEGGASITDILGGLLGGGRR